MSEATLETTSDRPARRPVPVLAPDATRSPASLESSVLQRITLLAARILANEPALAVTDAFGPRVSAGVADGPALYFEDHSEIALFGDRGDLAISYRALLLADKGDLVVLGIPENKAFEAYCRDDLGLGRVTVLRPSSLEGARRVPQLYRRCIDDREAMDRIAALARRAGSLSVVPYIGSGGAWRLAAEIAERSGAEIRVATPPPRLTRRVNDKLWFARLVADLLGPQALPPTYAAFGPAGLAARVAAIARRHTRVAVKLPDSAASEGNVVLESRDLNGLTLAELRQRLMGLLAGLGWRGTYPLMVEVWDCPVISSPSVQTWVPLAAEGSPVIAGVFDQVTLGETREFVGAVPSPAGSVHTVPFSDVGTVLNYTRDYSNVVLNIGVAYRENVDEVMKAIEDLGREMAEDPDLSADIITPLVTQGVQSLDDSAVIIRAKMMVKAGTQWGMKREFNRRLKNRFDELGIEIPFPQQAITFGEDKDGNAVAGRIVVEDKRTARKPSARPAPKGKTRIVQDRGDAPDGDGGDGET